MREKLLYLFSYISWPLLFTVCMAITAYGFAKDQPVLYFNFAYAFLAISLLLLEQRMSFAKEWNADDGQTLANIAHTLVSKGGVQTLLVFSAVIGLTDHIKPLSESVDCIWPRDWPLVPQIVLGVVVAEFGLYWAHRLSHEWMPLWRFHAIHHSVTRLWVINTGRFHFVDSLVSIVLGLTILFSLGAPIEVLQWLSAITAFIGMLTHCNVEMRFGVLSWIFNTPGLHRWHHSRDLREGNKNYGENVMIWDHIFGTYFNAERQPPINIGTNEYVPLTFWQQLKHPFRPGLFRRRKPAKKSA